MTNVTGFLRDPNQAPAIAAHNAETIENVRQDMLDHFARVVAEQIIEIKALRAVAAAAEWAYVGDDTCPLCYANKATDHFSDCPYSDLYAAGYLPVEETRP